jgi:hypothetical protein
MEAEGRPHFLEADFFPAPIRRREYANSRPKPNGPISRDYLPDVDFATGIENRLWRICEFIGLRILKLHFLCRKPSLVSHNLPLRPASLR